MSIKALAAKPQFGSVLVSNPLRQILSQPAGSEAFTASCSFAAGAGLATEEDFEMGSDFLDVFTRRRAYRRFRRGLRHDRSCLARLVTVLIEST